MTVAPKEHYGTNTTNVNDTFQSVI